MKTAKRTGEGCITIECPANEVHSKHGLARMFLNIHEARELAVNILDCLPATQGGIDAEMGADEYTREKEL